MIDATCLIIAGSVTAIFCVGAWWRWRGRFAPIPAEMFLVMGAGATAIALFYIGISVSDNPSALAGISRWIWLMIILSTAFMAVSVLRLRKGNDKDG